MNEELKTFVDEEKVREFIDKDPFSAVLFALIFFALSDWDIPQTEKIKEMMENINEQSTD